MLGALAESEICTVLKLILMRRLAMSLKKILMSHVICHGSPVTFHQPRVFFHEIILHYASNLEFIPTRQHQNSIEKWNFFHFSRATFPHEEFPRSQLRMLLNGGGAREMEILEYCNVFEYAGAFRLNSANCKKKKKKKY